MLNVLLNTGAVYVYAGHYISRTTDDVKFVIGRVDDVQGAERFLRSYWDVKGNGVSADAPNAW
jgi:hypothetical protein